jgi:hypothetical protein
MLAMLARYARRELFMDNALHIAERLTGHRSRGHRPPDAHDVATTGGIAALPATP